MVIIFREFLVFYQIFLSPQVKRSLSTSNRLVHTDFVTSLRTIQDLGSQEIRKDQNNLKTSWNYNLVLTLSSKKNLSIQAKDSLKIEIELFPQGAISHENQSFSQIFCPCQQCLYQLPLNTFSRAVLRTLSNICDGVFFARIVNG